MFRSVLFFLCLMIAIPSAYADFEQGRNAYLRGDYQTAWDILKPLADLGNPDALHWVGTFYSQGKLVEQDSAKALGYFREAAEKGHQGAQLLSGFLFYHGTGTANGLPDYRQAAKWLSISAGNGDPMGQFLWAALLYRGLSVDKDIDMAVAWYRKAASANHRMAQSALAVHLGHSGNREEKVEALKLLMILESCGYPAASENLTGLKNKLSPSDLDEARTFAKDKLCK